MNRAVDATDDNSNIPLVNLYHEKFKVDPWVLLETIREFMVDLLYAVILVPFLVNFYGNDT